MTKSKKTTKVYNIEINEKQIGKDLVSFNKKAQDLILKEFQYSTSITFYKLVINYLVKQGKDPNDILKYIKNYNLLFLSVAFYKSEPKDNPFYDFINQNGGLDFDKVLNLSVDNIKDSSSSIFKELLCITVEPEKIKDENKRKYTDQFKKLDDNTIKKYKISQRINQLHNSMLNNINYFNLNNKINDYLGSTNKTAMDLLIGNYLFNDIDYINYSFNMNGESAFENCLKEDSKGNKRVSEHIAILSCIIDNLFKSNNLDFKNNICLYPQSYYYVITDRGNKMKINNIKFIHLESDNSYTIIREQIQEFKFKYNNIDYIFTKDGIIKDKE